MKREERGFLESACMYMGGNYKLAGTQPGNHSFSRLSRSLRDD